MKATGSLCRDSSVRSSGVSTGCAASTHAASRRGCEYAFALLAFSALGLLVTYAIERLQHAAAA